VAIRAAQAGARVVASDLTPENFDAGRREASARGVELEWVEADAESLPFGDGEFDVVTSSLGAIFAPHHRAVADELVRVCRPGGTIGMIAVTGTGAMSGVLEVFERYSPPAPEGVGSPLLWGCEEHVRGLFGDRVESLVLRRERFALGHFADPIELGDYLKANHPVVIALYRAVAGDPRRAEALDRDLAEAVARGWAGDGGPRETAHELLLILARKRGDAPAARGGSERAARRPEGQARLP
jgi:hypothetical protein